MQSLVYLQRNNFLMTIDYINENPEIKIKMQFKIKVPAQITTNATEKNENFDTTE